MAEFQEVIKQFDRMCWHYQRKLECPMGYPMNGVNISQCRKIAFECPDSVERTVMSWAAEHPVVYPTWEEWLERVTHQMVDGDLLCSTIPADIAQKLELQPKGEL